MTDAKKKWPRIYQDSAKWRKCVVALLERYAPPIKQCRECWHPVIDGYSCTNCGNTNPREPKEEP